MKKIIIITLIILLVYLLLNIKYSKIFSHGELSTAHEDLDKTGKCEACHTKGKRLDNEKCLICHNEIKEKIEANTGLHARVSRECSECHSEHHGRSYSLVHLDTETFDHSITGWPLNERHALFKCSVCHSKDSYLLYKNRCAECHRDVHQGQFGENCNECHNESKFKVVTYNHKETERSPKGKHLSLACKDCHIIEYKDYYSDDKMVIRFGRADFTCTNCHEDSHKGELGTNCLECHNQSSFE